MGVAWHRFLAVVNVYARRDPRGGVALGPLQPMTIDGAPVDLAALEDLPDDARLGVGAIEDFTWKGLLDFSTCTECGRCQDQCPAWATGKPLSPKLVTLALRDHAAATAPYLQAGSADHSGIDLLGSGVIDPDALWACTSCGACVQQCPVDIEHVDAIVDMRRYQVLMESAFPKELGGTFTKLERQGNPWGLPARNRLNWAKGLDFEVPVVGVDVESAAEVEYLLLGRLRGRLRGPRDPHDEGRRRAAAHRGGQLRGAGRRRVVHRRPRTAGGQRAAVPDARRAERRGAQRGRRAADRRDLRALLQHDRPRVPAAGRPVRGASTTPSCSTHTLAPTPSDRTEPRPRSPTTTLLPGPAQPGLRAAALRPARRIPVPS